MSSLSFDDQFRSIIRDVPAGIAVFRGPEFVCELANDTYLQIVDRKEKDFVGKPLFEALPEVKTAVEPLVNDVYYNGVPYHGNEFPVILNRYGKSELAYFNFVYQPVFDNNKKINGFVVVATEVTDNVAARLNLAVSEDKFRNLVMQSPIAMTIFMGEDYVIDLANRKMIDTIWRKKEEEVMGKKALEVFPELNDQVFPALLRQVYTEGVAHSDKEALAYVQGDDGMRKFYFDYTYEPLFDANRKVFGIFITVTDVTDKAEYRKRIEQAEENSRLAIESADLGTYEIDVATNKMKASQRLLDIVGFKGTMSREVLAARLHPDDLEARNAALERSIRTGLLTYESRIVREDGKPCWVRVKGKVLRDSAGKPETLIGVVQDITEQKIFSEELERQVQERTEELQAANEEIAATSEEIAQSNEKLITANFELEQFNYAASHDLQEPVRKIQTFVSYLNTEGPNVTPQRHSEYLKKIMLSAERMKNIIDDLLLYATHTRTEKQLVATNLHEVVEAVKSELDLMIEQKNARIEIGKLPTVQAVPSQMHQLFRNLLSNSLKFTKPGVDPIIKINSTQVGDKVHIAVGDNGVGFKQEFADYVFKLFKRLHSKSEYDGTGIGLSLCKRIVENHGGEIYAESVPNEGTTMHVILPL